MTAAAVNFHQSCSEPKVSGWRVLGALVAGALASAVAGTMTHYLVHLLLPAVNPGTLVQVIVVEVYSLLAASFAIAFRPVHDWPLGLRFSSMRNLGLAFVAWLAIIAVSALLYVLLQPALGGLSDTVRKILSLGTDVKHLQGQPPAAWALAIPRGCLLAPLFEELFFRGALLQWLRRYFSNFSAIAVSAVLFAGMHIYPILMPYAFVFGIFTGWIRIRTGSTLNTVFMHVLDNVTSLYLGSLLLR